MLKIVDLGKTAYSILTIIVSFLAAYHAPEEVFDNANLITVLVTIFSVTAGVLIAIFSIIATLIHSGSWQFLENNRQGLMKDLFVFRLLFVSYFLALGLLIAYLVLHPIVSQQIMEVIRFICILVSVFAFMQSLSLPSKISSMYLKHYDNAIEQNKPE